MIFCLYSNEKAKYIFPLGCLFFFWFCYCYCCVHVFDICSSMWMSFAVKGLSVSARKCSKVKTTEMRFSLWLRHWSSESIYISNEFCRETRESIHLYSFPSSFASSLLSLIHRSIHFSFFLSFDWNVFMESNLLVIRRTKINLHTQSPIQQQHNVNTLYTSKYGKTIIIWDLREFSKLFEHFKLSSVNFNVYSDAYDVFSLLCGCSLTHTRTHIFHVIPSVKCYKLHNSVAICVNPIKRFDFELQLDVVWNDVDWHDSQFGFHTINIHTLTWTMCVQCKMCAVYIHIFCINRVSRTMQIKPGDLIHWNLSKASGNSC